MKYIHYGSTDFDINRFTKIQNRPEFTKPDGGFWGSRINAEYGWKNWCIDNDFGQDDLKQSFIFELEKNARILTIDSVNILSDLPINKNNSIITNMWCTLDFEKLSEQYDAIEVLISKDSKLYYQLYGWDCDSILVMNANVIKVKE